MNKKKEYVKNTCILLIGKFVTQFMSLFLLPLYTHYLLSADYGLVDLYQTYISLFVPVFLLCLDSAVFRFLIDSRNNKEEKEKIISSAVIKTSIQSILFAIIFFIISLFVKIQYYQYIIVNVILIMFSNIFLQICRGEGKNVNYSIACIITGTITLISNLILIIGFKFGASSILISSSLANLCCIIFIFISMKLYKIIDFRKHSKDTEKSLTKYSVPLIPNALSWWIVNVSDRTIISIVINTAANGIYTVSCKFSNILNSVFSIFTMSWQESASLHINDEDKDEFFSSMINNIYTFFTLISISLIFIVTIAFKIIIGEQYLDAYNYIPILILANSFNVLIGLFGGIYIAKKITKKMTSTTIVSAIINLVINVALIKFIGLYAACFSTLISYFIMAIYRYFDVQKYVKVKIYLKTIVTSIVSFITAFIAYYYNNIIISILLFMITLGFIFIFNIKTIKKYYNTALMKIKKNK